MKKYRIDYVGVHSKGFIVEARDEVEARTKLSRALHGKSNDGSRLPNDTPHLVDDGVIELPIVFHEFHKEAPVKYSSSLLVLEQAKVIVQEAVVSLSRAHEEGQ